jgi:hypothetical protein
MQNTGAVDSTSASPDSVLLDQVDKLAIQVDRSRAEDKTKPLTAPSAMGSQSFSNVLDTINSMIDGGVSDSAWR